MGHLFEINAALANGEVVSMPSDRVFGSDKHLAIDFLGEKAKFPYGSIQHSHDERFGSNCCQCP